MGGEKMVAEARRICAMNRVALSEPKWELRGNVHDFRNHVPSRIREVWGSLGDEARAVAVLIAQQAADNEEWD